MLSNSDEHIYHRNPDVMCDDTECSQLAEYTVVNINLCTVLWYDMSGVKLNM